MFDPFDCQVAMDSFDNVETYEKLSLFSKAFVLENVENPFQIDYSKLEPGIYFGLKFIEYRHYNFYCKDHNCRAGSDPLLIYSKNRMTFYALYPCCYTQEKLKSLKDSQYLEKNENIILLEKTKENSCKRIPPDEPQWRKDIFTNYFKPLSQFIFDSENKDGYVKKIEKKTEQDLWDFCRRWDWMCQQRKRKNTIE